MSPDPSLHDGYPFVLINGEKFYYGKDPEYGKYTVAHESDGKRYWYFGDGEQDMIDFLENLPESAEPPRLFGLPLVCCHGRMLQEDYSAVFEEHRKYLRFLLAARRRHGLTFPYADRTADGDR